MSAANRLLSGRVCIGSMMISATKLTLLITNKYASQRLSNGKSGKSDTPISTYQLFQNQIVPLICRTLVLNSGLLAIRKVYSDYCINPQKYDEAHFNNIVRMCCFIKPIIAWNANDTGNICRERCGGQGFLSINVVEGLISGAHSGITAEGDSSVLMQKVSKEYVEDFVKKIVEAPKLTQCPLENSKKDDVCNLETLTNLIKIRETKLLESLAEKTMNNMDNLYKVWMLEETNLIQDLAMIHGERYCLEVALNEYLNKNEVLNNIVTLYAAIIVKKNLGWYLMNDLIAHNAAKKLPEQVNALIRSIGGHAMEICNGFGIPESLVKAPIFTGYEKYYQAETTNGEHYNIPLRPKF